MNDALSTDEKTLGAARSALAAFDHDSMRYWIAGLQKCDTPDGSAIGKALSKLRKYWYHEGTYAQRKRVHTAAAELRHALQWHAEQNEAKRAKTVTHAS